MSKVFSEFENQMIIRFPEHIAEKLNEQLSQQSKKKTNTTNTNNPNETVEDAGDEKQLDIDLQITPFLKRIDDNKQKVQFKVKVDDFQSEADLIDLPCILETQKTLDRINFFKSNDVSQMILVHDNTQINPQPNPENTEQYIDDDFKGPFQLVKYRTNDGITPPTQNIRKRFFRQVPELDKDKVRQVELRMDRILKELTNQSVTTTKRKYKKKLQVIKESNN